MANVPKSKTSRQGVRELLIAGAILSSVIYLTWRALFTIPFEYGAASIVISIALLAVETLGMLEAAVHFYSMRDVESPKRPDVDESLFPDVDIFIATYNEPVELLYKTVNGCLNLDYPDKSKVHIYICDDGRREAVGELAKKMGVAHLTRPNNSHAKAGNLNNAMGMSSSPLIVTLDADMIPLSGFLTACVPYFLTSEKIGFVQTPQAFYNYDLFQYYLYSENRIPNEQDYFYRAVQVARNKTNTVIYGGSNTILSRQALNEIGGFVTGVITEDFATGMAIQSLGYKCIAISEVHASGLSPEDLKSLIKQRERWGRGCIQTGRKLKILSAKGLSLTQKFSYISSVTYWYSSFKRLIYILAPIAFSVFGVVIVKCTFSELLLFWLPTHMLNRMSIKTLSSNIRSSKWSNVYENILFPSLLPVILLETFGLSQRKFAVTRKDGVIDGDRWYQIGKIIPHAICLLFTLIGIWNCVINKFITGTMGYIVIMYWLLINAYTILMSIFFMMGREKDWTGERVKAALRCVISAGGRSFRCVTDDVSESGIAFTLDSPWKFPEDQEITAELFSGKYSSRVKGKLSYMELTEKGCKHIIRITGIKEHDYRQLLLLLYDRVPTIVQNLGDDVSSFEDIRVNLFRRWQDTFWALRHRLPQLELQKDYQSLEGCPVRIAEIDDHYLSIVWQQPLPVTLRIPVGHEVVLKCDFYDTKGQKVIYRITNYNQVIRHPYLNRLLRDWLGDEEISFYETVDDVQEPLEDEFDEMLYL